MGHWTINIIDWCKENGNPKPTWEVRDESVITTFFPSIFFATGKTPKELEQPRPKLRSKLIEEQEQVINLLHKRPL